VATEPVRVQPAVEFGDGFTLDPRAYELRRSGRALKLEPTPFGILAFLLEQRGELVSRQQIVERIWGKGVFLDTDNSINGAIRKIRQVLNDDPEEPRFIQTVTGKGYRFIARVIEPDPVAEPNKDVKRLHVVQPPQIDKKNDAAPRLKGKSRLVFGFALSALIAIGSAFWLVHTPFQRTAAAASVRSIAVLPLANLSADPTQEYFADGMTDELITDLAKVSALRVTSRTSVMRYKRTTKSLPEIARELNVDGIVEGSVTRSGDRVRITAQLLYAPTDKHLWAETYERDLGDVLRLQSDVAQAIAQQVRAQLTPQQKAQLSSARVVNPEAYELYLKGRYYLSNQFTTAQGLHQAKAYFEESVQRDPGFALAYSGLADSYTWSALFRQLPPEAAYQSATQAIHKALELDNTIGEAHDTLGLLSWRYKWDWSAAEREFNQAIAVAPSYSCAHEDYAGYLSFMGRRAEALAEVAKSREMDPGPSSAMTEAGVYYQLRDWASLVEAGRRGIASNPNEWVEHFSLAVGYEGTGKLLEAISEYQKAVEMSDGDQDAAASLAHAYTVIGKNAEAQKILRDLQEKSRSAYVSPYIIATIYAGLREQDRAFDFLERAYRERSLEMSWHIKADLRIDGLRPDSRFHSLLSRMDLRN
jgi:TolB-like protein/DNA-binding winged helix-turn-helix (wHTH) protein/Flp pilus assembly protein TadD